MPARTNDFQELVALIKRALARTGDTIRESAGESGTGLDTSREIDILHETTDGLTTIRIAVETKDEGRAVSVQTLDEYCGKYTGEGRVPVDKFMIVSRNGFTEGAREKAKLRGIPLLTLDEAKELDWASLGPEHVERLKAKGFNFRIAPHFREITIFPPLPAGLEQQIIREGKIRGRPCTEACDHGTLLEFLTRSFITSESPATRNAMAALEEHARKHPNGAGIRFDWNPTAEGNPRRVRFRGVDYPVDRVVVVVHAVSLSTSVTCKHYELTSSEVDGSRLVHHFSAEAGDWKFDWVMPHGSDSKQIAFKIGKKKPPRPNPKERAEERKRKAKQKEKQKQKLPRRPAENEETARTPDHLA